jgi:cystathionine gamma-lyase
MEREGQRFGTLAVHAGQEPDPATGAVMTPVYMTSTYAQSSPGVVRDGYDYARSKNPTRTALEANLAALEGGVHGLCFASGLAALDCVLHTLSAGDHVVLSDDVYGGTYRLLDKAFARLGVTYARVDMTDLEATARAMTARTRLVWLETPTNPLLKVIDIRAVVEAGKGRGAPGAAGAAPIVAVDNTFATPYLQSPLSLGADLVHHSSTKYLGGHSDLVGGALVTSDEGLHERLRFFQNAVGAVPGALDCFLLLRSTKTLHLRMERHCENAERVARWLEGHPRIAWVRYPGLASHPQHELAQRQMRGFGGMVTAEVRGGLEGAKRMLERARLFTLAESLGGVESLIEHPAIMTHASLPAEARRELGIGDGVVRLSVGVEDAEDLIGDLAQALE